jgi:DNA-binding SARP family transcriptional activator
MLHIHVFGETRVSDGDRLLTARDLGGVKPRLLLEYLSVNAGQPVAKARLLEVLWPADAPMGAVATLETYVSLLRRLLEPGVPAKSSAIRTVNGGYCLDPSRIEVDLHRFHELVSQSRSAAAGGCGVLAREALELVSGELLASDTEVAWADQAREHFSHELTATVTLAAGCLLDQGDHPGAIALARRALERDPYGEEAARHLITALWRMGRRGEALREYERLRTMLVDDLGVEPAVATRDLHLAILLDGEMSDWSGDAPGDEDTLVLELVRLVRMMVRERGVEQTRHLVTSLGMAA